jgi:hypothetical protein
VIVQFSDDAEIDLLVAVAFYEKHGTHVGDLFLVSITKDIKSLEHSGGIHSLRFGYHCMSSKKISIRHLLLHGPRESECRCNFRREAGSGLDI